MSDTVFLTELTYGRRSNIDLELEKIDELLSFHYFKSIDICNGESQLIQSIENFKPLYEKTHGYKLRRKAHVGEFGSAEDIVQTVETFELQEVHHGAATLGYTKTTPRQFAVRFF